MTKPTKPAGIALQDHQSAPCLYSTMGGRYRARICSTGGANDNQEIGEKIAIDNARQELWPLMGYALKERMASSDA